MSEKKVSQLKDSKKDAVNQTASNVVVLNDGIKLPMHIIHQWRTKVFSAVADRLCDPNLPIIQRSIGMWQWHTGISLPKRQDVAILGESAMRMRVNVGNDNKSLDFGVWLYLNEIRIGVRVPKSIQSVSPGVNAVIASCFDGRGCDIVKNDADSSFFDWVFRDKGIADKQVMLDSIQNDILAAMLADGIANALTHIYMAVMNALVTNGVMAISTDSGLIDADNKQMLLEVYSENEDTLARVAGALTGIGIHINNVYPQSSTANYYLITVDRRKTTEEVAVGISNVLAVLMCEHSLREVDAV